MTIVTILRMNKEDFNIKKNILLIIVVCNLQYKTKNTFKKISYPDEC